jgi:hypothetical protein
MFKKRYVQFALEVLEIHKVCRLKQALLMTSSEFIVSSSFTNQIQKYFCGVIHLEQRKHLDNIVTSRQALLSH